MTNETTAQKGTKIQRESYSALPLVRLNFILMAIAGLLIVAGFVMMAGGGSDNPQVFNPEIFSARRIVVGPAITFIGFVGMGVALIVRPRNRKED